MYARVRPLLKFETDRGDKSIVDVPDESSVRVRTHASSLEASNAVVPSNKTLWRTGVCVWSEIAKTTEIYRTILRSRSAAIFMLFM